MENPFKFGTIVEEEYFTDRVEEVAYKHYLQCVETSAEGGLCHLF